MNTAQTFTITGTELEGPQGMSHHSTDMPCHMLHQRFQNGPYAGSTIDAILVTDPIYMSELQDRGIYKPGTTGLGYIKDGWDELTKLTDEERYLRGDESL